jgi:hypothetical protein
MNNLRHTKNQKCIIFFSAQISDVSLPTSENFKLAASLFGLFILLQVIAFRTFLINITTLRCFEISGMFYQHLLIPHKS